MKIVEVRHPLVHHKIGLLRDALDSAPRLPRTGDRKLGTLLTYEATADLETEAARWPKAGPARCRCAASPARKITLVPILRAGLGMLPGVLERDSRRPRRRGRPAARRGDVGAGPYFEQLTGPHGRARCADPRSDARHRRHVDRDHRLLKHAGCRRIKGFVPGRRAGGLEGVGSKSTRMWRCHRGDRRAAQTGRLHPAGLGDAGDKIFGTKHYA